MFVSDTKEDNLPLNEFLHYVHARGAYVYQHSHRNYAAGTTGSPGAFVYIDASSSLGGVKDSWLLRTFNNVGMDQDYWGVDDILAESQVCLSNSLVSYFSTSHVCSTSMCQGLDTLRALVMMMYVCMHTKVVETHIVLDSQAFSSGASILDRAHACRLVGMRVH